MCTYNFVLLELIPKHRRYFPRGICLLTSLKRKKNVMNNFVNWRIMLVTFQMQPHIGSNMQENITLWKPITVMYGHYRMFSCFHPDHSLLQFSLMRLYVRWLLPGTWSKVCWGQSGFIHTVWYGRLHNWSLFLLKYVRPYPIIVLGNRPSDVCFDNYVKHESQACK